MRIIDECWNRRVLYVGKGAFSGVTVARHPAGPGEGPLTERIAGVQPVRRELAFMPETVGKRVG